MIVILLKFRSPRIPDVGGVPEKVPLLMLLALNSPRIDDHKLVAGTCGTDVDEDVFEDEAGAFELLALLVEVVTD